MSKENKLNGFSIVDLKKLREQVLEVSSKEELLELIDSKIDALTAHSDPMASKESKPPQTTTKVMIKQINESFIKAEQI